jgi:hypothetical protein
MMDLTLANRCSYVAQYFFDAHVCDMMIQIVFSHPVIIFQKFTCLCFSPE